ncbi:hypothetical protein QFZ77_007429 [Paenibacillus sp. V4I3]|nr:hypothetical protein [Paenibacillus sp. V4I3]MDQ0885378.1 hypothetical protein [Paenibacillus sp. V4I9]
MKKQSLIFIMLFLVLSLSACLSSKVALNTPNPSEPPSTSAPEITPTPTPISAPSPSDSPLAVSPTPAASQAPAFDPPLHFDYPDAVRGIYVTGWSAGGAICLNFYHLLITQT